MKIRRIAAIIPLTAVVMLSACKGKKEETVKVSEKIPVEAVSATMREIDRMETFPASVESEQVNLIAPQSPGRIRKINVEVGDNVAAGKVLAEMDSVNLDQSRKQLDNYKIEFERCDELYKVGGVAKSVWDSKKLAYDIAVSSHQNLLENTILCSPVNGVVTKRNYDVGDMYSGGAPLFVVEQIRPVKMVANVSESLFKDLKMGMGVEVTLDAYGSEVFAGKIKLIHPSVDPSTRTFPVEIQIPNSDSRIRPGMFGRITFNLGKEERIVIADKAVQKQAGSADTYVYVCKNDTATYRRVYLGRRLAEEYEIIDGIAPGEVVATTGLNKLNSGTPVTVTMKK